MDTTTPILKYLRRMTQAFDVHAASSEAPGPRSIFDRTQKGPIALLVSTAATFSTLASSIYFPAISTISYDLNVSVQLVNLTITSYLIFQGIESGAQYQMYTNVEQLTPVPWLFESAAGSVSTVAIGAGVIGDITTRADRGGYMGFFQGGMLVPLAVGPVIGGAPAGTLGWGSIFWFLTIYRIVLLLLLLFLLPETLRSIVANGGRRSPGKLARYPLEVCQRFTKYNRTQKQRPDTPITLFFAVYFTVWQMSITAMSTLYKTHYALIEMQSRPDIHRQLHSGKLLGKNYRRIQAKHEIRFQPNLPGAQSQPVAITEDHSFPLEKARLRLIPLTLGLQYMSILLFGWTIRYSVHIAVPIVSTFITGWTFVSTQSIATTYLVDIFPDRSAAATASLNLARCVFAAGGLSFVIPLVDGVGAGVAFTICVAVQLVAAVGLGVQWRYAGV
ncbi:hypothetical protein BBP40_006738 [Aspergillus hancockii]|nr:hypothetical protein BBP40_006738 [Aspergillus hancockii]